MQFNLTANSSNHLKFSKIGSAISTDTVTLTIKNLTVGGDYQWLVKSDVTDLDEDAIAGDFGEIENSTINILLPLPKANFDVGSTYYFALREFNGSASSEVIQVSFTISQNAILGNGTSILVLPPNAVTSVNGETGVVVLTKAELGLGNVDNTSDLDKPLSTATSTALNLKANGSDVVHKSGNETITGAKVFQGGSNEQLTVVSTAIEIAPGVFGHVVNVNATDEPGFDVLNNAPLRGFTDQYATLTWRINTWSGIAEFKGLKLTNLPTSSGGLGVGDVWNDNGTLKIV